MELLLTKLWLLHDSSRPYDTRRPKPIYKEAQEPIYFMIATMQSDCKEKHKALGIQPLTPIRPQTTKSVDMMNTMKRRKACGIQVSHQVVSTNAANWKNWSENGD